MFGVLEHEYIFSHAELNPLKIVYLLNNLIDFGSYDIFITSRWLCPILVANDNNSIVNYTLNTEVILNCINISYNGR